MVTPILFLLLFAVIDFGLVYKDKAEIDSAAGSGARTASASGQDPFADYYALQAIKKDLADMQRGKVVRIVIFKSASQFGGSPSSACQAGTDVAGQCNAYSASDLDADKTSFGGSAGQLDAAWAPSSRNISMSGPPDYVGVWIKVQYTSLVKVIPNTALTTQVIIRMEPTKL